MKKNVLVFGFALVAFLGINLLPMAETHSIGQANAASNLNSLLQRKMNLKQDAIAQLRQAMECHNRGNLQGFMFHTNRASQILRNIPGVGAPYDARNLRQSLDHIDDARSIANARGFPITIRNRINQAIGAIQGI